MKKYLLILLLIGQFSNAQYNLFARQNFSKSSTAPTYNTYIGGVSATISTASALATKLGISVGAISNFTIVGSDIKCKITGSYAISTNAFDSDANITNYIDSSGLVTALSGNSCFYNCIKFKEAYFPNLSNINGSNQFALNNMDTVYIPNCVLIGGTVTDSGNFNLSKIFRIYANPSMSTINSGGIEGDLAYAITQGSAVNFVSSYTVPSAITDLTAGMIYNTAMQLNFTPPSSTNAIDFYECYANGVFKKRITGSGQYISGLTENTSYSITVKPVDIYYNKSSSNSVSQTTTNSLSDMDASAYITASGNTTYQYAINDAFKMFKDNSLYTKIQAWYPFLGTTATQQKWNAKNPLDTDAAFRLTFSGTGIYSNLGYQTNGSNTYANTYLIPSTVQNINSNGLTIAVGTNNSAASGNVVEIGSYVGAVQASYLMVKNNNTNYKRRASLNAELAECSQSGVNESRGIFTGSKQSSTNTDLFVNGVQVATSNQSSGTLPSIPIFIGGLNFGGSAITFSNQRIQTTMIHEGLSDAEASTLYLIIDAFEESLERKTW